MPRPGPRRRPNRRCCASLHCKPPLPVDANGRPVVNAPHGTPATFGGTSAMKSIGQDSLNTTRTLQAGGREYRYFSLPDAYKTIGDGSRLPVSLKILLENVLRFEDGTSYRIDDARAIAEWAKTGSSEREVPFK